MKKIVSLLLTAVLLVLPFCSMAEDYVPAELPSYLDVYYKDGQKFNIKDQDITVRIAAVYNETNGADMTDSWIGAYIKKYTGINLEWAMIPASAKNEQQTLLFLDYDNIPDILFAFNFGTASMINYGEKEGQLLDLAPYINEETMPALTYIFSQYPEWKAAITTPEGHIYSLPRLFGNTSVETLNQGYMNQKWLTDHGYDMPKTLEELNTVLYAYKAENPDCYPLGGGANYLDPRAYILNAFGWLCSAKSNSLGLNPAVKNNEVVIPVMEDEYYDFLKLLHQYYVDGIIDEAFFTKTEDMFKADFAAEKELYAADRPTYFVDVDTDKNYHSVYPLTSEFNAVPAIQAPNSIVIGGICLAGNTKYAEEICRLLDYWYTDEGGIYSWSSAMKGEDTLGMFEGWYWRDAYVDETTGTEVAGSFFDPDTSNDTAHGGNGTWTSFHQKCGRNANPFCNLRFGNRFAPLEYIQYTDMTTTQMQQKISGMPVEVTPRTTWDYITNVEANVEYLTVGWPDTIWMSDDQSTELSDLKTALNDYVEPEIANFIVGNTELTEENWANFLNGLNTLNIEDYKDLYIEVYEGYQAALK